MIEKMVLVITIETIYDTSLRDRNILDKISNGSNAIVLINKLRREIVHEKNLIFCLNIVVYG